jgi:wyosine [tRNA(Phe)-imidazoG37] synthetase (radical SAM superfamily)
MSASRDSFFNLHPRDYRDFLYVYPVLSRRAGGLSIGVNLNRNQFCNFHCVYCQVEPIEGLSREDDEIDLKRLAEELDITVESAVSGRIFDGEPFKNAPPPLRRLNDIALSGDGEPTACPDFVEATAVCAEVRRRRQLDELKIVLITNASLLDQKEVQKGLKILDENNGEIWAKLDAGTEAYYRQVARSAVAWRRILDNLSSAARVRPIVIQTLFMRIDNQPPPADEVAAYCQRLREIVESGGQIKLVQIHTVARPPAETTVAPLANAEVDAIAEIVRRQTNLPVAAYYGG